MRHARSMRHMGIALLAMTALLLGLGAWRRAQAPRRWPASGAAAARGVSADVLKGRWLRPDGGYVLEIRAVDGAGRLDAAYFNPRPIHVARAESVTTQATLRVFVELRDVNYPGSTYTLTYDRRNDRLAGEYFQAALRQRFEVAFVRTGP